MNHVASFDLVAAHTTPPHTKHTCIKCAWFSHYLSPHPCSYHLALTLGLTLGLGLGLTLGLERRDDGPPASGEECAQRVRGDAPRDGRCGVMK